MSVFKTSIYKLVTHHWKIFGKYSISLRSLFGVFHVGVPLRCTVTLAAVGTLHKFPIHEWLSLGLDVK